MGAMDEKGRRVSKVLEENGRDEQPIIGAKRQARMEARIVRTRRLRVAAVFVVAMLVIAVGYTIITVSERSREASRVAASTLSPEETVAPPFATIGGTRIALHLPA